MENSVDIEKIEQYTNAAIHSMNDDWSFEGLRYNLDKAFDLCSPNKDLGYYEIIAKVFRSLKFKTKSVFQTNKLRAQYALMYEYLANRFHPIALFPINENDKDEALVVNNICCDIHQGAVRYYEAFLNATPAFVWGVIAGAVSISKIKKMFLSNIRSIASDASYVLRRYKSNDPQILDNIKVFEKDAK